MSNVEWGVDQLAVSRCMFWDYDWVALPVRYIFLSNRERIQSGNHQKLYLGALLRCSPEVGWTRTTTVQDDHARRQMPHLVWKALTAGI